jgi:hypothetical protein
VPKGEQKTFVFLDTTLIVEKDNPDNTGQLKDMMSRPPEPPTLTWNGPWTRDSENKYTSSNVGYGVTWETLTITATTECRLMVMLTASCNPSFDAGYATKLDGVQSASNPQLSVTGTTSRSYTYTVPVGTHTIHFGFEMRSGSGSELGSRKVTVEVVVQ